MASDRGSEEESPRVWGWLVQVISSSNPVIHSLDQQEHRVGRDGQSCSIVLGSREAKEAEKTFGGGDPNIFSRQHFAVSKAVGEDVAVLEDLSRNGTWVDGVSVGLGRKIILQHCSKISMLDSKYTIFQYIDRRTVESLYCSKITSRYLVSDLLGEGASAVVRKAYRIFNSSNKSKIVALKMINIKDYTSQYTRPKNVEEELEIQTNVRHPTIVRIEDVIRTEDMVVLVMEHLKGGDMFEYVWRQPEKIRPEEEAKVQFYQIAHCVRHLHRSQVAHRDLKLENVILCSSTSPYRLKLTDFGLSKVWSNKNQLKTFAGTPAYMAPEVARLEHLEDGKVIPYSQAADCWSLGVLLFTLLSGRIPFSEGPNMLERILSGKYRPMTEPVWARISSQAKDLVRSLLEVDPEQRMSSEEVLQHPWLSSDQKAVLYARKIMIQQ